MKQLIYILFFIVFISSHFYFSRNQQFRPLGDNITYLIGAESFYYDRDFVIDNQDFARLASNHPKADAGHIPIIGKETSSGMHGVSKPLIFMVYLSFFTPIKDELLRAQIANVILIFSWFVILYFLVKKLRDKFSSHFIAVSLFSMLLFLSQANFYLNVFHPEIFINTLVIVSSLPLFISSNFSKKRYFYIFCGLVGSLLFSEKQLALFFPLVTAGFLFLSNKHKSFFSYVFGLFLGGLLTIFLYQVLYGTFTPYDGARGMIRFRQETVVFKAQGAAEIFTFPGHFANRFIEYFFGRNIGVLVYNSSFLVYIMFFIYYLFSKKVKLLLAFLPIFLYLFTYFLVVSPTYSYGGATSLGNRYFFQVYVYVLFMIIFSTLKLSKIVEKSVVTLLLIPVISFSSLVYIGYYHLFPSAIKDHLIIPEHRRIFSIFPRELAYARLMYSDLPIENHWENTFIINGGYPLIRDGDNYLLNRPWTYVVFFKRVKQADSVSDIIETNVKVDLVRSENNVYLYKITCEGGVDECIFKSKKSK